MALVVSVFNASQRDIVKLKNRVNIRNGLKGFVSPREVIAHTSTPKTV